MTFQFSRHGLQGRERTLERVFELLPGLTSWTLLIGMCLLSFWRPVAAAVLIIAYDLYWLLRLFYMTLFLIMSYLRLSLERDTNWMARIAEVDRLAESAVPPSLALVPGTMAQRLLRWSHRRALRRLGRYPSLPPASQEIYHVVIMPIAKEPSDIFEPGIASLAQQQFPAARILIVLAVEARAADSIHTGAREVQARYRDTFLDFLIVTHPDNLPEEARVKGANTTYAAKTVARYLLEREIAFERVIVSCFDADTVVNSHYMSCLTYHFLICPQRTRASFQPIPVYHNNIWDVPGFARVLDIGSSFFQLIEATNAQRLVTFSSHSMSFQALVDIGYWPVDMISDDSAIFWKALIHFDGDYRRSRCT